MSNKEKAQEFLRLSSTGSAREAFARHVGEAFIHHNPWCAGDRESLMLAMEEAGRQRPDRMLEMQRALEEGELVAIHSRVRQSPTDRGSAVVHLFRFADDKIVELWDVGQGIPEEMANQHGMF